MENDLDGYMSDQDIFADEDSQPVVPTPSPKTPVKKTSETMCRLRSMLTGIPPPPEKTNPQLDMTAILAAWNQNNHLWWEGITQKKHLSEEEEKQKFDVYPNLNNEEEEVLRLKVAERLIACETSSSFIRKEVLTNSAKKRQRRNGWAKSPGSRLSYLAKRRTTFSQRPNLSQPRTISISRDDKKKERNPAGLKRALFQSPDKPDYSTPDMRSKRLKLSVSSPKPATISRSSLDSRVLMCTRNLGTEFEKFKNENAIPRQHQLYSRTPLAALSSTSRRSLY